MSEQVIDHNRFIKLLTSSFPELRVDLEDEDNAGLLTLQVSVLKNYIQDAIHKGDNDRVRKCFDFVITVLETADDQVNSSIFISCLIRLDFQENTAVRNFLPKHIRTTIDGIVRARNDF